MAFARPTLAELISRTQQDAISRLELVAPLLRRSMARVLARVVAGASHLLHGHLEYLGKQIFPGQSDGDFLVRQAALFGLTLVPASYAEADVIFTGTSGSVIPARAVLSRSDGALYTLQTDVTLSGGVGTGHVIAQVEGSDGSLTTGGPLSFVSPVAGVAATATVAVFNKVDGADQESPASLTARLIGRMQSPPHGGNAGDYIAWTLEVPGVTRAWCYPLEGGVGTVKVRFVRDHDTSIFPGSGEVAAVQAYLTDPSRAPATDQVTAVAPTPLSVPVTCHISPDTTATRLAVQASLSELFQRASSPAGVVLLSDIQTAIRTADGVLDRSVSAPATDVGGATGQLPVLGTVTFT
jgi:uncharacterized phage protein gp47/JayE